MENIQTEQEIRELVDKAAGGSREAISSLLKTFTSDMYFITRLYVGDKETARSSEQNALRTALRSLKDSYGAKSFADWLSDIVRNTALSNIPSFNVTTSAIQTRMRFRTRPSSFLRILMNARSEFSTLLTPCLPAKEPRQHSAIMIFLPWTKSAKS